MRIFTFAESLKVEDADEEEEEGDEEEEDEDDDNEEEEEEDEEEVGSHPVLSQAHSLAVMQQR